ncbi:hypothetical protein [Streptomyces bohaiensis]|uniref:Secreted protein n=1 Tax=Streptomyces bohaiensis TaxID=1431344 RepID=A0ABX1C7H2_9ACTN|nr:hypothetical protein [Streptomyces bohaiensis]NJQ13525.1 hypothetical protein [Streptomyces bohaiensis]
MIMKFSAARRAATVLCAALMLTATATPTATAATWSGGTDSKSARLDVSQSGGGWVGYATVKAVKVDTGWRLSGTMHKASSAKGCLNLKTDRGRLVPGSAHRAKVCDGSKSFNFISTKDRRVILEWSPDSGSKTSRTITI